MTDRLIVPERSTKPPSCRDITTDELASVQIGSHGKKLWVCVDGYCVLRVKASEIVLTDLRVEDAIRQQ